MRLAMRPDGGNQSPKMTYDLCFTGTMRSNLRKKEKEGEKSRSLCALAYVTS